MGTGVRTTRVYQFGAFTVDARTGELSHAGRRTPLRDQSVQLLLALLEKPGELITREELAGHLWAAGTFVDFDRGLNKAINHLREALGDSAEQPNFIETLPRKVYRFIAPVTCAGGDVAAAPPADAPYAPSPRRWLVLVMATAAIGIVIAAGIAGVRKQAVSLPLRIAALAVLPLENLSHDPEQQYFADGLTDALITDLAKMGTTRITSRTSVIQYRGTKKSIKDIGRELNVDAVPDDTTRRSPKPGRRSS